MSINSECSRKRRHVSEACAKKALANQLAGMPPCVQISPLIVYKCKHCPYWHVGHKMPEGARRGSESMSVID